MSLAFVPRIPLPPGEDVIKNPERWRQWAKELNAQLDAIASDILYLNGDTTATATNVSPVLRYGPWGFRYPVAVTVSALSTWYDITTARLHGTNSLSFTPTHCEAILSISVPASKTCSVRLRNLTDSTTIVTWTGITSATTRYTTSALTNWPATHDKDIRLQIQATSGSVAFTANFGEYQCLIWP